MAKLSIFCSVHHKRIFLLFLAFFLYCFQCYSQRYSFEQYDIENGLAQSQVTSIVQDGNRRLWIATLSGISCFNGKQFTNYNKTNGISSNFILSLAVSNKNDLWIGSARGLTRFAKQRFRNYNDSKAWVDRLAVDKSGKSFALKSKKLYLIGTQKEQRITVSQNSDEIVTALRADYSGKVWSAVYQQGLYYFENNKWHIKEINEKMKDMVIFNILKDKFAKDKIWLLTTEGIYIAENNNLKRVYPEISSRCTSITQDKKGNIWIGTTRGAYCINAKQTIHFNSKNGFTDNIVNEVFQDAEDNIWLGTDGSGMFRFRDNSYVTFDESQGLQNKIVMGIANGPTPGEIWIGTNNGLYQYKNQKINRIKMPSGYEESDRINFVYNDRNKNVWIGTPGGGLWLHNGENIVQMDKGINNLAYNAIIEDSYGKIWLSTNYGCITLDVKTKKFQHITKQFGGSLLEIGKDSIITGTQDGAWLIIGKKLIKPLNLKAINGSSVLCMTKIKDHILFGTADYGLYIWNSKTGNGRLINTKSGLAADHVYSILKDRNGIIWIGTGKGINKLNSSDFSVIKNSSDTELIVECNQNAILEANDQIWIGTTRGTIIYNARQSLNNRNRPYIFINSVKAFPSVNRSVHQDTSSAIFNEFELNKIITLPYDQNHININYTGIYLSNPNAVMYKYRLLGLDTKYSTASSNSSINFTSVPPGKYTFEVIAITKDGIPSQNTASFSFEILPPFYQTNVFRFVIFIMVVLIIILAVYIILTVNERKRKLRLKIKLEEQFKIRKQTAEDFHDDLGNKLTRITVLSEVLSSMIDKDDTDKKMILKKINNNVDELYTGTKDILWSLNPKNDTLSQLLVHISDFGKEMFNETSVNYQYDINISNDNTKLSLDMSRNMLMIFKEAIHNALKHSKADHVYFSAVLIRGMLMLSLRDNGTGFDAEYAKNGHGINNMYVRAKRIHAELNITSGSNGTSINLSINFSTLAHFKNV